MLRMSLLSRAASEVPRQSGATLLIIILSIVVMAVFSAAMYSITSTSFLNQASSQQSMKDLYIAESGLRIAASEFKAAVDKNTTLENLNGKTFTLPGGEQFTLHMYPYWFIVAATYTSGDLTVTLKLPGSLPRLNSNSDVEVTLPTTGRLMVMKNTTSSTDPPSMANFTGRSLVSGQTAMFNFQLDADGFIDSTGFSPTINAGEEVYLVVYPNSTQTVSQNGSLTLNNSNRAAQVFPPGNGSFSIYTGSGSFSHFQYKKRNPEVVDPNSPPSTIILEGIYYLDNLTSFTQTFLDNDTVFLGNNLLMKSTSFSSQ